MKNIVICCDGTGNEYGRNNTNVVECFSLAVQNDRQIAFYDPGVGTGGWEYNEETKGLKAKSDLATGRGLQKNVEDAYSYLMETYEEDDRLYLFGFSRGAFTVRSLAGMLHKCGLLRPDNDNLLEYASKIYGTKGNDDIAAGFKATFSRACPVHFIGVWDTVKSLLLNAGKRWYDARLNPEVKFGYQALSIDEKRRDFPPSLWDQRRKSADQTIEQVWFAGVHSDVGGWYDERGLANVSLRWMMAKAVACDMEVDRERLGEYRPDPHDSIHESYDGFWTFRGSQTRKIPEGALVHESVLERMETARNKYAPRNLPRDHQVVN